MPERNNFWSAVALLMFCEIARDGCFNAAQWIFAFEYFVSATSIPSIFNKSEIPHRTIVRNKVIFWSVLVINFLTPCFFACLLAYGNVQQYKSFGADPPSWFTPTYLWTKYMIGIEQLISGFLVIAAVIIMRRYLKEYGMEH
jgi:hypothetical protein